MYIYDAIDLKRVYMIWVVIFGILYTYNVSRT
jgi:hypothetical protein